MIPGIVKTPVSLAHQLTVGAVHLGVSSVSAVLRRVLPVGDVGTAPSEPTAPSRPHVSTEPVTQPPSPQHASTPVATTTMADPAPATTTPATRATAKRATAKKAPAKKAAPKRTTPSKPAATLDEPVAPVDDDPVVYSSGPEVAESIPTEDLEGIRLTRG